MVACVLFSSILPKRNAPTIALTMALSFRRLTAACPYSKLRMPKKSWSFSGIRSFEQGRPQQIVAKEHQPDRLLHYSAQLVGTRNSPTLIA